MRLKLASEALQLATVEPVRARELGAGAVAAAAAAGDWVAASVAERAIGVSAMQLSELDTAIAHLRAAVTHARRAGSRHRAAEARMSLASALVLRGQPARAFRQIDTALHDLGGVAAARARSQRAAILQEVGRADEALEDLRRALPVLRRAGDAQWATRALSNRSLLLVGKRAFAQAEADLVAARRLCEQYGLALHGVIVEQNLGCLSAQRGDVPRALHHFSAAENGYRELRLGDQVGTLLVDRASLLLSIRLVAEARVAAEAAVSAYEQQKRQVHLPEAQLVLSTVALVEGDHATALHAAEQAEQNLRRLGRRVWLPLARYARIQALLASNGGAVSPAEARRVAERLTAAGWPVPGLEARVLAGWLALERGQRRQARRDLAQASRARFSGPAEARARAWLAEAMLRRADGDRRRTGAALRAGLRVLEQHRATLGATELRAHVSSHRDGLAQLGLRMAIEDGDPRAVLWWAERGRASALLLRPVRPPEDATLAQHLSDLRTTMREIQQRQATGLGTRAQVQRQVRLERAIRDHCRQSPGSAEAVAARPRPIDQLAAELGESGLVEYVELDDRLYAVTVAAGRTRLHALGSATEVRRELDHLPFALHRLASRNTRAASRAAASAVLQQTRAVFEEVLVQPLGDRLAERSLVIVPSSSLHSLPWSLVPSYASRPLVVSPSATLWHLAARQPAPAPADPVVLVAGPGLPGALAEVDTIAALYPDAVRLAGDAATATRLLATMDGAALVHLAAHGVIRGDNPLFSALRLADGPFTIYDLERLGRAPRQVVLAACESGRPHVLAGEEILGFTAALLPGGTRTLVAPVVPVPDAETAPLMRAYHGHLHAGRSPAEALAQAQAEVRAEDQVASAAAAGFVCLGAGLTTALPAGSAGAHLAQPA
jgi:CHAT domain-containing protein/tetratricopeptide (TPR) repeat protein